MFFVRDLVQSDARLDKTGNSLQNFANVNAIQVELKNFLNHGIEPEDMTVLTLYRGQTKLIVQKVCSISLNDGREIHEQFAEVTTVDSYQGKENDVVPLSIVAANPKAVNKNATQNIVQQQELGGELAAAALAG